MDSKVSELKEVFFKRILVLSVISAIAFVITGIALVFMPDQVPMHYNVSGEIDRIGSKYENYIFPAIIMAMNIFWIILIKVYDRKAEKAESDKVEKEAVNNSKILYWTAVATSIFFIGMQIVLLWMAANAAGPADTSGTYDNIGKVSIIAMNVLMGFLFIFMGNMVPKAKNNRSFGVRTKWSMANDTTWRLSNRFGGRAMIISGFVVIFLGFIPNMIIATYGMLVVIAVMTVACVVYSKKIYEQNKEAKSSPRQRGSDFVSQNKEAKSSPRQRGSDFASQNKED